MIQNLLTFFKFRWDFPFNWMFDLIMFTINRYCYVIRDGKISYNVELRGILYLYFIFHFFLLSSPHQLTVHIQSGRNIRHLPCVVRRSGIEGVCMFAIDCIKANGTHLGTCIDRFYFGSCCQLKVTAIFWASFLLNRVSLLGSTLLFYSVM